MSKFMNDISLQHQKNDLEIQLKEIDKKIKVIPELGFIFRQTSLNNLKYWIEKWGDYQHLHIEFDIDCNSKPDFGWTDFEDLYDFGWHIIGTNSSSDVPKNRFQLILRRNAE